MAEYKDWIEGSIFARIREYLESLAWALDVDLYIKSTQTVSFYRERILYKVTGKEADIRRFKNNVEHAVDKHNTKRDRK